MSDSSTSEWPIAEPGADGIIAEWYAANADGSLHIQRCDECSTYRHPPRFRCAKCHSDAHSFVEVEITGKVISWTVVHKPLHPGFMGVLPYVIAVVELSVGVRLFCILRDVTSEEMEVGKSVSVGVYVTDQGAGVPFATA